MVLHYIEKTDFVCAHSPFFFLFNEIYLFMTETERERESESSRGGVGEETGKEMEGES